MTELDPECASECTDGCNKRRSPRKKQDHPGEKTRESKKAKTVRLAIKKMTSTANTSCFLHTKKQ